MNRCYLCNHPVGPGHVAIIETRVRIQLNNDFEEISSTMRKFSHVSCHEKLLESYHSLESYAYARVVLAHD